MMPKLRTVEIQGFRSFRRKQELLFGGDLAVLWGPNSQGKTSLCEAIEFLLTGTTVRRDLTAGSQDEFAGALRNVHMAASDKVYVQATIESADGARHVIRRTLLKDFEKRGQCDSRLELDGRTVGQDALHGLGIVLSQAPMQAPILLQHTLSYLFSARPADRSTYFKALLEVADLDDLRRDILGAIKTFGAPPYKHQSKLEVLKGVPVVLNVLKVHFRRMPSEKQVRHGLELSAVALLEEVGAKTTDNHASPVDQLRRHLEERQRSVFPVSYLRTPPMPDVAFATADTTAADGLRAADSALEKEVERLGGLYRELLRVHPVEATLRPADCPACGTPAALTPERLQELQRRLRETDAYHAAVTRARRWLVQTRRIIEGEAGRWRALRLLPSVRERKTSGFGTRELVALLGADVRDRVAAWVCAVRQAAAHRRRLVSAASNLLHSLPEEHKLANANFDEFRAAAAIFIQLRSEMDVFVAEVDTRASVLREAVGKVISHKTSTVGWQEVIDLHADAAQLSSHLRYRHALDALTKEHDRALKNFDAAMETIVTSKFSRLSDEMRRWWELLRPESLTVFESVGMRAKATRTVDFKVALYADETQHTKTIRDAIAVFSGSQLHCLGVAAFLARSVRDRSGFLVLDDPVLSSDHEHRSGFVNRVIEELITEKVQVILLTQEQRMRDDVGVLYQHLQPELFRIELPTPLEGTTITKTSDALEDRLARIRTLLHATDDVTLKQAAGELRDVAEQFCKGLLARHYGPPKTPSDFDGQVLGALIDLVDKEKLFKRPDEKGKLGLLRRWTNPGNHDAPVPEKAELTTVHGHLKKFVKDYA